MLHITIAIWLIALIVSGISPLDRLTWGMEVFPVVVAIPTLWLTKDRFRFPNWIYFFMLIHGLVLIVGGHYTYAEVPIGFWVQEAFHLSRNHYDRLGHFMQGFVPGLIACEIFVRQKVVNGSKWRFVLTVSICMAFSVSYEFLEWAAALLLGQGADAFLGTQGDPWDTHWDMFMATIGSIVAFFVSQKIDAKDT